jgi:hypothetical protein
MWRCISIALISAALSGCASTQEEAACPPTAGFNQCEARKVIMNPYADPETRRYAQLMLMDNQATTPNNTR